MKKLIFIFCCLFPFISMAQIRILKGFVKSIDDDEPVSEVEIKDLKSGVFTYTDKDGYFEIQTQSQHQLQISSSAINTQILIVQSKMFGAVQKLSVRILSTEMKEFVLFGQTQYQQDSAERYDLYKQTLERKKDKVKFYGFVVENPISSWMQYIAPKTRAKWKYQKQFAKWEEQKFVDSKYTNEKVAALTGLQGDTLAYFMNAYPIDANFLRQTPDAEFDKWILNNFQDWKVNPKIPHIDTIKTK